MIDDVVDRNDPAGEAVGLMRMLGDPTRLRLLGLLQSGPMNVSALCKKLSLAQPTVSHHLGLLRQYKLVNNRRDGKQVFYSLNPDTVTNLDDCGGLTVISGPVEVRLCNTSVGEMPPIDDRIAGNTTAGAGI